MKHYLSITALSVILAACSSGSGSSNSEHGIQISGIAGLNYQIGNRTGVIKDGTQIDYKNGDEITFLLGKLELAKIKAKDKISLADFWTKLPTTAKGVRAGLRKHYDVSIELTASLPQRRNYAYGTQPTLHRASNIMQLLIAMDADGNTANGIDLVTGDWSTKLAELNENSLPLNAHLAEFSKNPLVRAFSQKYSLPLNMDIATPLKTLYQMANKTIKVQPVTGYVTLDTSPTKTITYDFNDKMQLQRETEKKEGSTLVIKTHYEYDSAGNIKQKLHEIDREGDGIRDKHTIYRFSYNDYGIEKKRNVKNYDNSNLDPLSIGEITYIIKDNKVLIESETSRDKKETHRGYFTTYSKYNELGLLTQKKQVKYDASAYPLQTNLKKVISYNKNGTLAKFVEQTHNTNGGVTSKTESTYTYSGKNVQADRRPFNVTDNTPYHSSTLVTDTLNDNNRLVKKLKQTKKHTDNTLTTRKLVNYEYDSQGRLKSCTTKSYNALGQLESTKLRQTRIYDDKGLLAVISESAPVDSDTFTIISGQKREFTYGEDGRMLSKNFEGKAQYKYADADTPDGVAYLVHEMMLIDNAMIGNPCDASVN